MVSISLAMIVKDEEKTLNQCLKGIHQLFDEIIIVDTGSKDKTINIAKKYDAKVFEFKWDNNFSKARNYSLSRSISDWILILDADEIIKKHDMIKIKEIIQNTSQNAFFLHRNEIIVKSFLGFNYTRKSEIPKSKLIRLIRNNQGLHFSKRVCESIITNAKLTDINFYHMKKYKRDYRKVLLLQLKDAPYDSEIILTLIQEYIRFNEFDKIKKLIPLINNLNIPNTKYYSYKLKNIFTSLQGYKQHKLAEVFINSKI